MRTLTDTTIKQVISPLCIAKHALQGIGVRASSAVNFLPMSEAFMLFRPGGTAHIRSLCRESVWDGQPTKWYKKIALTGDWTALVRAASEVEVRELYEHEQRLFPTLIQQYPGPYRVEELPPGSLLPPVLEALERGDVARVEQELGLHPAREDEASAAKKRARHRYDAAGTRPPPQEPGAGATHR